MHRKRAQDSDPLKQGKLLCPYALWVVNGVRSFAVLNSKEPKHAITEGCCRRRFCSCRAPDRGPEIVRLKPVLGLNRTSYQPGSESTRQDPLSRPPRTRTRERDQRRKRVRQIAATRLGHILAPWKEAHYGIARGDAARLSTRPHRASPPRGEGCPCPGHFRGDLA